MSERRTWSLRNRLLGLMVAASAIAWLVSGIAVLRAAHDGATQSEDAHLEDVAHLLLLHAVHDFAAAPAAERARAETGRLLDGRYRYQVWSADGVLLRASGAAPREPFSPLTQPGHQPRAVEGAGYRVYSAWSPDRAVQVQVAGLDDTRGFAIGTVAPSLLLLFVACTAALVLLAVRQQARLVRALEETRAHLVAGTAGDAHPPAVVDAPRELQRLIDAATTLRRRFADALDAERRFTAAAAHELRTPLAAVRVQAQVAERARTPQDAREALALLHVCVDRASRTIDQLLTLAQFESARVAPETSTTVELASLAARVIHDLQPLLRSRGIEFTLRLEPVAVAGLEHGLAALLRNLIDNAARHSPPNSRLHVTSGAANGEAFVAVEDSGPGIPPQERERVFERFYRLGSEDTDGVGVGLSIAQSVVRAHGGRIVLSNSDLGGLRAEFFLSIASVPQAAADQAAAAAGGTAAPPANRGAER